jgi:aerobic-type carbon monoxide dehydrogenase small subunit (CoxS/CutS family)
VKLNVNGADVEVDDRFSDSPLLWVLRDVLELHGPKYGCGIGQCAACTVLIDGRNTKSCQTPAGTSPPPRSWRRTRRPTTRPSASG